MKVKRPANDNLVHRGRLLWEQRAGRSLADEDLREVSANITNSCSGSRGLAPLVKGEAPCGGYQRATEGGDQVAACSPT